MHFFEFKPFLSYKTEHIDGSLIIHELTLRSKYLKRKVRVDLYLPESYRVFQPHFYPALLLNDGQDCKALGLSEILKQIHFQTKKEFVVIGIHAGDRIEEYGTAGQLDYLNRGQKAKLYQYFVIRELVPYLYKHYRVLKDAADTVIAGFSLGGLSAMDIAWHYSRWFGKVGVFSGSFWWRSQPLGDDPDAHRIMHQTIADASEVPNLSYWFQAGTEDETCDRNNNGVIDAIDDTLDVIKALKNRGYPSTRIVYNEIEGGQHNFDTWSSVFPEFLDWAFELNLKSLKQTA